MLYVPFQIAYRDRHRKDVYTIDLSADLLHGLLHVHMAGLPPVDLCVGLDVVCWTEGDVYCLLGVHRKPRDVDVVFDRDKTFIKRTPARRVLSGRAVVVDMLLSIGLSNGATELRRIANSIRELGMKPILYLDMSKLWRYPWDLQIRLGGYFPDPLDKLVVALNTATAVYEDGEVSTVSKVLSGRLGRHSALEISGGMYFLKELVQSYSNCGEDVAAEVAEATAKHYCGRAAPAVD